MAVLESINHVQKRSVKWGKGFRGPYGLLGYSEFEVAFHEVACGPVSCPLHLTYVHESLVMNFKKFEFHLHPPGVGTFLNSTVI